MSCDCCVVELYPDILALHLLSVMYTIISVIHVKKLDLTF